MAENHAYKRVEMGNAVPIVEGEVESTAASVSAKGVPMVEIVSPATLPEGYSFDAQVGDRIITVTVPPGGVEEGQRFTVPAQEVSRHQRSSIPIGAWKDGLFDCCVYGPCHAQCWLTYCCPLCALGQVMQRLNLTWRADYTGPGMASRTCAILAYVFGAYIISDYILSFLEMSVLPSSNNSSSTPYDPYHTNTNNPDGDIPAVFYLFYALRIALHISFLIFFIIIMVKTRRYIRDKYAIPERACKGCEDCCCSYWCAPCTICQMARHTADYDTYQARCCTSTGLPPNVPAIV